jgi:hypothetical protein
MGIVVLAERKEANRRCANRIPKSGLYAAPQ